MTFQFSVHSAIRKSAYMWTQLLEYEICRPKSGINMIPLNSCCFQNIKNRSRFVNTACANKSLLSNRRRERKQKTTENTGKPPVAILCVEKSYIIKKAM